MARLYHFIIAIYAFLMSLHLSTSLLLFFNQYNHQFYEWKTFLSIKTEPQMTLDTTIQHMGSMGLVVLILGHFLWFIPHMNKSLKWVLGLSFAVSGFLDILCNFNWNHLSSVWLFTKTVVFFIFEMSYLSILWVVLKSSLLTTKPK